MNRSKLREINRFLEEVKEVDQHLLLCSAENPEFYDLMTKARRLFFLAARSKLRGKIRRVFSTK
jgi:hypothetical protein